MFLTPTPHHIRFVAAPPEGGESTGGTGQPPASAGTENAGDPIDWEAKYKEALGHSRDWEKKAKANKAAADELEKLKESQMSETEKAAKRTQELEAQVAAYKAKEQQADWKAQVSAETGVPADVIEGDSLEAMQSHAKRIHELLNPKPKARPCTALTASRPAKARTRAWSTTCATSASNRPTPPHPSSERKPSSWHSIPARCCSPRK